MKLNDYLVDKFIWLVSILTTLGIAAAICTVLYLCYLLVAWIFTAMADGTRADDLARNKDCYYLVLDPIAAKEGESQWLRVEYKDVTDFGRRVSYKIDDTKYTTNMFIFCQPNND